MSLLLWIYIQVVTNPVVTKNITVPINKYQDENLPDNVAVDYSLKSVELEIVGRAGTLNNLTADDIVVSIDYSDIDAGDIGIVELPVNISSKEGNSVYFRVENQYPRTVFVTVYSPTK